MTIICRMSSKFSRLEAQLERLIEGAFTQLFGKTIRPQDIALRLSRAMEDHLQPAEGSDPRPFAPDYYRIRLNAQVHASLLSRQPALADILSQHLVSLVNFANYRLKSVPQVDLIGDSLCTPTELDVTVLHSDPGQNLTSAMDKPEAPQPSPTHTPRNAQLVINGTRIVPLESPLINIGRGHDNTIVLDDLHVSRHHIQLRMRFGHYTVFDTNSRGGTRVNDVLIREHRLQPGDVIRIGKTQIVYIEDTPHEGQTGVTAALGD